MYCPAGQEVTAAAKPASAVALHTLVTYCVALGAAQLASAHVALIPALTPDAV